jgi:hypothetical protein
MQTLACLDCDYPTQKQTVSVAFDMPIVILIVTLELVQTWAWVQPSAQWRWQWQRFQLGISEFLLHFLCRAPAALQRALDGNQPPRAAPPAANRCTDGDAFVAIKSALKLILHASERASLSLTIQALDGVGIIAAIGAPVTGALGSANVKAMDNSHDKSTSRRWLRLETAPKRTARGGGGDERL